MAIAMTSYSDVCIIVTSFLCLLATPVAKQSEKVMVSEQYGSYGYRQHVGCLNGEW